MMLEDLQRRNYAQRKPGALAVLCNLRNMKQAGVDESLVLGGIETLNTNGVWPFRFLPAARYARWTRTYQKSASTFAH